MLILYRVFRTLFLAAALYTVDVGAPVYLQYIAICLSSIAWCATGYLEGLR